MKGDDNKISEEKITLFDCIWYDEPALIIIFPNKNEIQLENTVFNLKN